MKGKLCSMIFLFLFLTLVQSDFYLVELEGDGEENNHSGLTGNDRKGKRLWNTATFFLLKMKAIKVRLEEM